MPRKDEMYGGACNKSGEVEGMKEERLEHVTAHNTTENAGVGVLGVLYLTLTRS
jgi:hypothetical protein